MEITDFSVHRCRIPLDRPIGDSQVIFTEHFMTVLELKTDDGRTGVGFELQQGMPTSAVAQLEAQYRYNGWSGVVGQSPLGMAMRIERPRGGNVGAGVLGLATETAMWDLAAQQARQRVRGRVVEQQPLTHDITRLVVQLEQSLPYKAGQYADLSFDLLPQHARSFSFATRQQPDAQVSFFIRKVQGGVLTSAVHSRALVGESVTLEGPLGDFYLRPARAPLLLVAGGSGLAPILALLEEALATGGERPVTLLFGARAERDLYALEQINSLAGQWNASFNFVPVLSDAALDASWRGVRGQVTELIGQYLAGGSHAYLCGPPGMIDSAIRVLLNAGVAREHIYFDRFTTLPAPVTASA